MKDKRGRKPNSGVLSGIRPEMTSAHIRNRIIWGSAEWEIIALRHSIGDDSKLADKNAQHALWDKLRAQFERAVLNGDADSLRRQAKAIEKGGNPQRARFNWKVVQLFEMAMWGTRGKHGTPTPAGTSTNAMASDIFNALKKRDLPNGHLLVEGCQFESKERVMEAIHDLERQLQFALRSAKITRTVKAGGSACHSEGE